MIIPIIPKMAAIIQSGLVGALGVNALFAIVLSIFRLRKLNIHLFGEYSIIKLMFEI